MALHEADGGGGLVALEEQVEPLRCGPLGVGRDLVHDEVALGLGEALCGELEEHDDGSLGRGDALAAGAVEEACEGGAAGPVLVAGGLEEPADADGILGPLDGAADPLDAGAGSSQRGGGGEGVAELGEGFAADHLASGGAAADALEEAGEFVDRRAGDELREPCGEGVAIELGEVDDEVVVALRAGRSGCFGEQAVERGGGGGAPDGRAFHLGLRLARDLTGERADLDELLDGEVAGAGCEPLEEVEVAGAVAGVDGAAEGAPVEEVAEQRRASGELGCAEREPDDGVAGARTCDGVVDDGGGEGERLAGDGLGGDGGLEALADGGIGGGGITGGGEELAELAHHGMVGVEQRLAEACSGRVGTAGDATVGAADADGGHVGDEVGREVARIGATVAELGAAVAPGSEEVLVASQPGAGRDGEALEPGDHHLEGAEMVELGTGEIAGDLGRREGAEDPLEIALFLREKAELAKRPLEAGAGEGELGERCVWVAVELLATGDVAEVAGRRKEGERRPLAHAIGAGTEEADEPGDKRAEVGTALERRLGAEQRVEGVEQGAGCRAGGGPVGGRRVQQREEGLQERRDLGDEVQDGAGEVAALGVGCMHEADAGAVQAVSVLNEGAAGELVGRALIVGDLGEVEEGLGDGAGAVLLFGSLGAGDHHAVVAGLQRGLEVDAGDGVEEGGEEPLVELGGGSCDAGCHGQPGRALGERRLDQEGGVEAGLDEVVGACAEEGGRVVPEGVEGGLVEDEVASDEVEAAGVAQVEAGPEEGHVAVGLPAEGEIAAGDGRDETGAGPDEEELEVGRRRLALFALRGTAAVAVVAVAVVAVAGASLLVALLLAAGGALAGGVRGGAIGAVGGLCHETASAGSGVCARHGSGGC